MDAVLQPICECEEEGVRAELLATWESDVKVRGELAMEGGEASGRHWVKVGHDIARRARH